MNVEAWSSSSGGAHPKRPNPSLRSSSGAPASRRVPTSIRRCPCVTPSRETFVTVVNFIVTQLPSRRVVVRYDGAVAPISSVVHTSSRRQLAVRRWTGHLSGRGRAPPTVVRCSPAQVWCGPAAAQRRPARGVRVFLPQLPPLGVVGSDPVKGTKRKRRSVIGH